MNPPILNRQGGLPGDGYYHIEPLGEHVNHRSKVVLVIDEKAVQAIANRFTQEAAKPGFAGQRIDKDHLSHSEENPTEAMGWSKAIVSRADGLYAQVKWTPLGRPLVKPENADDEPAYKFFSTEYDPEDCEKLGTRVVNGKPYDVLRPLRIDGLSLTNDPNNKGQRPISNRGGNHAGAADKNQPASTMKKVNTLLGLAEDASEESAVAAIQAIQNRATKAEGQVTTLTTERDGLLTAQVEADLEKYKNRFKPADREKWKKQLISNRAGTVELLESISVQEAAPADPTKITNRGQAKTPEQIEADKTAEKERARGQKIANRAAELRRANPRLSRAQAFKAAEGEIAE